MKKKWFTIILLAGILLIPGCAEKGQERKELNVFEEDSVMQEWKEKLPEADGAVEAPLVRGLSVEQNGQELFTIAYAPKDYKSSFAWWEITEPYSAQATVNTETFYALLDQLDGMELSPGNADQEETGVSDSETYITIAQSSESGQKDADAVLRYRIGKSDGKGHVYASSADGEKNGTLPESAVNTLLELDPYNYILKIPVLPDITTVSDVEAEKDGKLFTMSREDGTYIMDSEEVDEEEYNEAYQTLLNILITGEIPEGETPDSDAEPILTLRFIRNTDEASDIEVIYYPYNDSSAMISINGSTCFLADRQEVETVCHACFDRAGR